MAPVPKMKKNKKRSHDGNSNQGEEPNNKSAKILDKKSKPAPLKPKNHVSKDIKNKKKDFNKKSNLNKKIKDKTVKNSATGKDENKPFEKLNKQQTRDKQKK